MHKRLKPRQVTLLGLLSALVIILSLTPLGYLRIGPLSATLNMIPVAIAAISMGTVGGAVTGLVFGLTSFLSALMGGSPMGVILMGISPALTFVQSVLPRLAMGLIIGLAQPVLKRVMKPDTAGFVTGFLSAGLNTLFYMSALVLLFGNTDYLQNLIAGRNILVFACAFVGVNAVFELFCATVIVGLLARAMGKAHLIGR